MAAWSGMHRFKWRILVVGCQDYRSSKLSRSVEAATIIFNCMQKCSLSGENQVLLKDPDTTSLEQAVDDFLSSPSDHCRLFFYFAGHGYEHNGQNYMVSIDGDATACIQDLRRRLQSRCLLFAIFDACRERWPPTIPVPPLKPADNLSRIRRLQPDWLFLYSCLAGERRSDDTIFAEQAGKLFLIQGLQLQQLAQILKESMPNKRVEESSSIRPDCPACILPMSAELPSVSAAVVGLQEMDNGLPNISIATQLELADSEPFRQFWLPCLYVFLSSFDLLLTLLASLGFFDIEYSNRVSFMLSTSSFFWASFSYKTSELGDLQCHILLVRFISQHWCTIEVLMFRLRTPIKCLLQIVAELVYGSNAWDALSTACLGILWFLLCGYFLTVVRDFRSNASRLARRRASSLWGCVVIYAAWAALTNLRLLSNGASSSTNRWVEMHWQLYLILLVFSFYFILVLHCDPLCNAQARSVIAYVVVPLLSIMAVATQIILMSDVNLYVYFSFLRFLEYVAIWRIGTVIYVWQQRGYQTVEDGISFRSSSPATYDRTLGLGQTS